MPEQGPSFFAAAWHWATAVQDPAHVVLAALVCAVAMSIGVRSLLIWREDRTRWRQYWLVIGAAAFGAGAWTTHFLAMIGWRPDLALGFDGQGTMASAMLALFGVGPSLFLGAGRLSARGDMLGGAAAAVATALMHVVGMVAVGGCSVSQDVIATVAATGGGMVLAALGLRVLRTGSRHRIGVAAGLLTLAIVTVHFGALAGTVATPGPPPTLNDLPRDALRPVIAFAAIALLIGFILAVRVQMRADAERNRLSTIVLNTQNAVMVLDPEGRVDWVNPAFRGETGYTRDDLIGRNPAELMAGPATAPSDFRRLKGAIAGRHHCEVEIGLRRRNGTDYWAQVSLTPVLDYAGEVRGQVMVLNDVTGIRQREAELARARDRAERASRAKSEFISIMSHELRTPLNGVLGMAALLSDSELSLVQRGQIATIAASGNRLLKLLNDILEFSEASEQAGRCEPFAPAALLAELRTQLRSAVAAKGLRWECVLDPALPLIVHGDLEALLGVLVRLTENAVKFTDAGGVTVRLLAGTGPETGALLAEVEDTGSGVPDAARASLFEGFAQGDSSPTRRVGGVGLGLALCRRGVERMGGHIAYESPDGGGSLFRVILPGAVRPGPALPDLPLTA